MVRSILILSIAALVAGCDCDGQRECPSPGQTQCDGDVAQICDSDLRWQPFIDCSELGGDWVCERVEDGHTCVPREDARDGGAS